ncbi:MAG TPA: XdhC family protein, partial [Pseudonocardiaceae bacterium]|nr:XdhC family protein [Pseudonocardiaceae bacterium]
ASTVDGSTVLVATKPGLTEVIGTLGGPDTDEVVLARMRELVRIGATVTEQGEAAGTQILLDVWVPVTTMLIVGRGAIGSALAAQCELLGWAVRTETEVEPAVAAAKEFTAADVLVLLDHGPAFDAVLVELLRSGRGFCGALGSRHTQEARRRRLRAAGIAKQELARLHGPVGLDLGAARPAETAVSVVGEVLAVRRGRSGGSLATAAGRIGG